MSAFDEILNKLKPKPKPTEMQGWLSSLPPLASQGSPTSIAPSSSVFGDFEELLTGPTPTSFTASPVPSSPLAPSPASSSSGSVLENLYGNLGSWASGFSPAQRPPSLPAIAPISSTLPGGVTKTQGSTGTTLTGFGGNVFGSSNFAPSNPIVPAAPLTGNTPFAQAYEKLWSSSPDAAAASGVGGSVAMAAPAPVKTLQGERDRGFTFSDGGGERGIGGTPALMSSGGLDRGGPMNEARARVAQQDFNDRIISETNKKMLRGVTGNNGRESRRITSAATPAKETIDVRTAKAARDIALENEQVRSGGAQILENETATQAALKARANSTQDINSQQITDKSGKFETLEESQARKRRKT